MKKTLFLASLVLLTLPAMSQGRKYTKAMGSSIEKMNEAADPASELELVASFEEIAQNYPDQWLPSYHASRILVLSSFEESDGTKSDAIQKSKQLNPENPRAYYMDGMMTSNMPEFLGGGPEAAKPILLEAQEKFKTYHHDDPFWPTWGEDLNQGELDRLKE